MRIGNQYPQASADTSSVQKTAKHHVKGHASAAAAGQTAEAEGVKVTVSAKARELEGASAPEESAKVQALKAQVEGGTLNIDAAKIASKIVGD